MLTTHRDKTADIMFALDDLSQRVADMVDLTIHELILLNQFPNLYRDEAARKAVAREIGIAAAKALVASPNEANLPAEAAYFWED